MERQIVSFKHSGNAGDVIYALQAIEQSPFKAQLLLNTGVLAYYYSNAPKHPVQNESGQQVMLNEKMVAMLRPLLEAQPYISSVEILKGQDYIVDLDNIRQVNCGMPNLPIQKWYGYAFPDLSVDISKQWLTGVAPDFSFRKSIIINRTSRYQNPWINYSFLKNFGKDEVIFAGLAEEHADFCDKYGLDIPLLAVDDFKQLASYILGCGFFIGNQSMCFGIAEGFKVTRLLETCTFAPNVIPVGGNGYDFLSQEGLEYHVNKLYEERCIG